VTAAVLGRAWRATTHFLADLLALETPEIPVATALVVVAAFLLEDHTVAAVVILPAIVVGALAVSVWRAKGKASAPPEGARPSPPR
jgi:hypothetical protein